MISVYWDAVATPVGQCYAAVTANGVWRTAFGGEQAAFLALPGMQGAIRGPDYLTPVWAWVAAYFAGQSLLPLPTLDLQWVTPFQTRVYAAVLAIPMGETRTYGAIAAALGRPHAARAVGAANARNPLPLLVPCHRLVGQDGSLRGYGSGQGIATKRWLLDHERRIAPAGSAL